MAMSADSIKQTASDMTTDMMSFYTGDQPGGTPGLLPDPYYCRPKSNIFGGMTELTHCAGWEAGALMGALIDYWYYTGDTKWNNVTQQGLLWQVGPNNDYMPPNQTRTEGNDDQGFWGMAVMTAAEYNFQNPPANQPQWLALAQAVFNTQAARWESQDCGGGLRWQIFTWNNGFDYKNSISQACFFNLAARLALYTGNQSYADWADKTWDWMISSKFMDSNYYIYDGAHIENCSDIVPYQFSYNAGAFLLGAAAMYNYTNGTTQDTWKDRVDGLLNGTQVFFTGNESNIMTEVACEPVNLCDTDQQSFKAYLSRWMAATTKWAPWTFDRIKPLLQSSAIAAAAQCTGGQNGRMCGLRWTDDGKWDGTTGVGQQMAAMEVVLGNMITEVTAPLTNTTGGTSVGNAAAGGSDVGRTDPFNPQQYFGPVTTADRAGAIILTVVVLISLLMGLLWILLDETSDKSIPHQLRHIFDPDTGAAVLAKRRSSRDEKSRSFDSRTGNDRSITPSPEKPLPLITPEHVWNSAQGGGPGNRPVSGTFDSRHWRMSAPNAPGEVVPHYMTAREARFSHPAAANAGRSLTRQPSESRGRNTLKRKPIPDRTSVP
jgi:mannan endo-1,6-alpha-mannosidase